jgi:predicted O-methyltransferase YrrM
MGKLKHIIDYASYRLKSDNQHGIHSPFVFDLYNDVIVDTIPFYVYEDIESIRAKLLLTDMPIKIEDHGAGSSVNSSSTRPVKDIAKNTLKSAKYGQLLFRLVNRFKPKTILELGTSLGVSTMYLAAPSKETKVITVEGCPNTAKVADVNFKKIGLANIELVNNTFDEFLPKHLASVNELDFVFFDGNHQEEATKNYFNRCLEKTTQDSVFVFDDIHWSEGMTEAWDYIKAHPKVTTTIDLFFVGIVFFNPDLSKEDFVLKF